MNRILKIYLPIFLVLLSLSIFSFGYLFKYHPVLLRFAVNQARVHTQKANATVKVDGIVDLKANVFLLDNENQLLVQSYNSTDMPAIVIVDKSKNDIGTTNSRDEDYHLYFGNYLFQSDSAYAIVYASSEKWGRYPDLEITESKISYKTTKLVGEEHIDVRVEIFLDGE